MPHDESESGTGPTDKRDWQYLDDAISALWLGSLAFTVFAATITAVFLIITGDIHISGTLSAQAIFRSIVAPIILMFTGLALLDVYGKRRVKTLINLIRND